MEGIEFLQDKDISLLETKGIHTVADLDEYQGDDKLILPYQLMLRERVAKLAKKLNLIQNSALIARAKARIKAEEQNC